MATVSQHSLTEELDTLKARFEALCAEGKVSAESRALVEALRRRLGGLMEKTTPKGSAHSSLASSRTTEDETALARPGAKAKGPVHNAEHCTNTRERVKVLTVERCARCGEDLADTDCLGHERRTLIDVVFEKGGITPMHKSSTVPAATPRPGRPSPTRCPARSSTATASRPRSCTCPPRPRRVGAPRRRTPPHHAGPARRRDLIARGPQQPLAPRLLRWLAHRQTPPPKRGCEAIAILPRYAGVAVHDCWASSLSDAHLLRELTFIIDAHDYAWAKRLLLRTCHQVATRDHKTLTPNEYKALRKRYRTLLTQGARELPPIPPRLNGQRGRVAKSDAHNLWERLQKHEAAVLLFANHPHVAFTNNRAERDLRMSKVKQKVSGCFRTRKYAEAYCRISSYLQSMANQGYNPLVAIQIALAGDAVKNLGA